MSKNTVHRILKVDIALFLWKIQVNQPITGRDDAKGFEFVNPLISMFESCENDFKRIWLSDKAQFHLQGCVYKYNWRF